MQGLSPHWRSKPHTASNLDSEMQTLTRTQSGVRIATHQPQWPPGQTPSPNMRPWAARCTLRREPLVEATPSLSDPRAAFRLRNPSQQPPPAGLAGGGGVSRNKNKNKLPPCCCPSNGAVRMQAMAASAEPCHNSRRFFARARACPQAPLWPMVFYPPKLPGHRVCRAPWHMTFFATFLQHFRSMC